MSITPRITALVTGTAIALAALGGGTVSAQQPEQSDLQPRLERVCRRVPNLQLRTDNVLARIQGDADTRGSLLWLDGLIAEAADRERTQLVEVLTNRRAVREASIDVLVARQQSLATIARICADNGVEL